MDENLQIDNAEMQDRIPTLEEACSYIDAEIIKHIKQQAKIDKEDIAYHLAVIKAEDVMKYETKLTQVVSFLKCTSIELDALVETNFKKSQYTVKELASIGITVDKNAEKTKVNANILIPYLIKQRMLQIVRGNDGKLYHYTGGYWKEIQKIEISKLIRNELQKLAPNSWKSRIGEECLKVLQLEVRCEQELEEATNLLNTSNVLINLVSMKPFKHNDNFFSTNQLPVRYAPKAKCPKFIAFLQSIFTGDEQYITLIQEIFGYCLWDGAEAEKIFLWYGTGANGKSVLAHVLQEMLGKDNYSTLTLEDIASRFGADDIINKKVNIATENELNLKHTSVNVQFLKKVSSGEEIYVERKFENKMSHVSTTKMIFLLNNFPEIKDKSDAFYRRLIIIPFNERFTMNPKNKTDKVANVHLKKELVEELEGILTFAIEGLKRLKANNFQFTIPKESQAMLEEYRIDNNPIAEFLDEIDIFASDNERVDQKLLFNEYLAWAEESNLKKTEVIRTVLKQIRHELPKRNIAFEQKPSNGKTYLIGVNYSRSFIKK